MKKQILHILLLLVFIKIVVYPQQNKPLTIIGDSLKGKVLNGEQIREVIGNVIITQKDVVINCNKAVQYFASNKIFLLGDVVVNQDSLQLKTQRGFYFDKLEYAYSDTNVTLNDGTAELTANTGYYYTNTKKAFFQGNVNLVDSATILISDKLTYYDSLNKAIAYGNVTIKDTTAVISTDSLLHLRDTKYSEAYGNVKIKSLKDNILILGDTLISNKENEYTRITGEPMLMQIDTSDAGKIDTLVIFSKLLESYSDSTARLIATDSVKMVRGDFSSINDKSVMYRKDDVIETIRKNDKAPQPLIWYENSQILGDSVHIFLKDNELKKVEIKQNAILFSKQEDYDFRFDQISGDTLNLHFDNGNLQMTHVLGGVLSIYYTFEDGEANGLIKSSSSEAKIFLEESKVSDVKLYGSPVTEFHPEKLVQGNEKDFTLPLFKIMRNKPDGTLMKKLFFKRALKRK